MSLVACIISCMSQLCVLCQMIVDLGCSCFSAYCIVISKPQQQQLQKTTTTTMESFFKRALKTHLFSTTRRHWDVFVILSPDINIQAYLLTYCYYCCCCYCYYALDVLRALILCRCRRFINHLLTYLLTYLLQGLLLLLHLGMACAPTWRSRPVGLYEPYPLLEWNGYCCRYTWTCSVFLSRSRSCFTDDSLDEVLLPQSAEMASIIRPVTFSGRQLRSDANDFLFTLTVWKRSRPRSSTTQLLTTSSHSAGDQIISEAQLK